MKKKIFFICMFVVLCSAVSASALTAYSNYILHSNGGTASSNWVTADKNYKYSKYNVTRTDDGDNYIVYFETKYNDKIIRVSNTSKQMHAAGHTGSIIWYPKNYTTNASATHKVQCSGQNTTENYCAIQKSQYRWTSQNNSWLGGTAIVYTTLTLYN